MRNSLTITLAVALIGSGALAATASATAPAVMRANGGPVAHAAGFMPNDPGRGKGWAAVQWNLVGTWGVNAPGAWDNLIAVGRPGGQGVKVAVLDTGVAYRNYGRYRRSPDFHPSQFVRGYDFVDNDKLPLDRNGHGTHVAATIAERTNNGLGLAGIAYGVRIMPIRVLDDRGEGDAREIARGIRFAVRNGAKIINLSLEFATDVTAREIPTLLSAISYATSRGSLVVAASGNEGEATIAYPARAGQVLSVGATTEHGCLSDYSNQGPTLDLVAPGGGPDADLDEPNCKSSVVGGRNIFQITLVNARRHRFAMPGDYAGTSMAVPHVSATAALVVASGVIGPNPTPTEIQERLQQTARDLGPIGPDSYYGAGLIDAAAATNPAIKAPAAKPPAVKPPVVSS